MTTHSEDAIKGRIAPLIAELREVADELKQAETLLPLLREIETIHRDIQEGPFRQSLPEDRQDLYTLLQTMEKTEAGHISQGCNCALATIYWVKMASKSRPEPPKLHQATDAPMPAWT